jgi:hypothetical protein
VVFTTIGQATQHWYCVIPRRPKRLRAIALPGAAFLAVRFQMGKATAFAFLARPTRLRITQVEDMVQEQLRTLLSQANPFFARQEHAVPGSRGKSEPHGLQIAA